MGASGMVDDRQQRFDRLFTENVHQITAFALRRTNPEDAKDVVSQTFTVAWRRIEDVPPILFLGFWELPETSSWSSADQSNARTPSMIASPMRRECISPQVTSMLPIP
jgi:hypothetical protein